MRHALAALLIALPLAAPAPAQEAVPEPDAPSLMERGLSLFMEGLATEMEPTLRDLEGIARESGPLLDMLRDRLGTAFDGLDAYHAPEVLENGDILIRRRRPGDGSAPDGSVDL